MVAVQGGFVDVEHLAAQVQGQAGKEKQLRYEGGSLRSPTAAIPPVSLTEMLRKRSPRPHAELLRKGTVNN